MKTAISKNRLLAILNKYIKCDYNHRPQIEMAARRIMREVNAGIKKRFRDKGEACTKDKKS